VIALDVGAPTLGAAQASAAATSEVADATRGTVLQAGSEKLPLQVERGLGVPPLLIPRDESLEFVVHVEYGPLAADLGSVWLRTGVKPYQASLLLPRADPPLGAPPKETAWVQARAKGGALTYESDTTLTAWHLPQAWPSLRYTHEQKGSEVRSSEQLFGFKDGAHRASLRRDTDKGAPRGSRIWKDPKERDAPAGTIDMVSAGYLARQLFSRNVDQITAPMIDKNKLWDVTLRKGGRLDLTVPAGRFEAVELVLITKLAASEPTPKDPADAAFEGPFGIHGDLKILLEAKTGVPLRFEGTLPLGILGNLHAEISLVKYRGTPLEFAPKSEPQPAAAGPVSDGPLER
jgi:hypothetical protein